MLPNKVFKPRKQKNLLPAVLGYVVIEFLLSFLIEGLRYEALNLVQLKFNVISDQNFQFGMNEQNFRL